MFVMLNRGEHWQCAYVIAKDSAEAIKQKGLPAFREAIKEQCRRGSASACRN